MKFYQLLSSALPAVDAKISEHAVNVEHGDGVEDDDDDVVSILVHRSRWRLLIVVAIDFLWSNFNCTAPNSISNSAHLLIILNFDATLLSKVDPTCKKNFASFFVKRLFQVHALGLIQSENSWKFLDNFIEIVLPVAKMWGWSLLILQLMASFLSSAVALISSTDISTNLKWGRPTLIKSFNSYSPHNLSLKQS